MVAHPSARKPSTVVAVGAIGDRAGLGGLQDDLHRVGLSRRQGAQGPGQLPAFNVCRRVRANVLSSLGNAVAQRHRLGEHCATASDRNRVDDVLADHGCRGPRLGQGNARRCHSMVDLALADYNPGAGRGASIGRADDLDGDVVNACRRCRFGKGDAGIAVQIADRDSLGSLAGKKGRRRAVQQPVADAVIRDWLVVGVVKQSGGKDVLAAGAADARGCEGPLGVHPVRGDGDFARSQSAISGA